MEHQGEILRVDGNDVVVRMGAGNEECSGCAIVAFCSRPTEVKVSLCDGAEPGRQVVLSANVSVRSRAVWLLVALPLILLVAVLLGCTFLGLPQWACGLAPLGVLAVWYVIVGLTVGHKVRFRIERLL